MNVFWVYPDCFLSGVGETMWLPGVPGDIVHYSWRPYSYSYADNQKTALHVFNLKIEQWQ